MPFVPLGSRKRLEVVLDDDKARMSMKQQQRDQATIDRFLGGSPNHFGYRFAQHPATMGNNRGPVVPFKDGTCNWRPPSADPNGPASIRSREQADYGARLEASHRPIASMHKTRSAPNLPPVSNAMEACHPLSNEILKWKDLGVKTVAVELKGVDVPPPQPRPPAPPEKEHKLRGLVMFPRYMLIHNCHLKQTDMLRFQKAQEEEERLLAEEEAGSSPSRVSTARADMSEEHSRIASRLNSPYTQKSMNWQQASWGAPLLKNFGEGQLWAGSPLPSGRMARSSNPLRM